MLPREPSHPKYGKNARNGNRMMFVPSRMVLYCLGLSETWDILTAISGVYYRFNTGVGILVVTSTMKLAFLLLISAPLVFAFRWSRDLSDDPPTVTLDSAEVTGINENGLSKFLGIPFAQPPLVLFLPHF